MQSSTESLLLLLLLLQHLAQCQHKLFKDNDKLLIYYFIIGSYIS
jgi:hypothetical protein